MTARQFGRDSGDTYGRHALRNPGGDNVQRDVLHLLYPHRYALHPTRVTDNYVGAHRNYLGPLESWTVDRIAENVESEYSR